MRVLGALLMLLVATQSEAQFGFTGAQSTLLDPSVRLSGMGRSGTAVFWGRDLSDWANPAILPYNQGLLYEWSRTQLVPELAHDVFFTTNRITWGAWGMGVSIAGQPIDVLGGNKVDYGESIVTDVDGNELGRIHTTEDDNTVAVGASAMQLLESLALTLGHRLPSIDRFGDVSIGHAWKQVKYHEEGTPTFFGSAEANKRDRGYLLRATPYNAIDHPGMVPAVELVLRMRIDASYGAAELNYDGDSIRYTGGMTFPVLEDHRHGRAFRVALAIPKSVENSWRDSGLGWLYDLATPLVSYGRTSERSQFYLQGDKAGTEIKRSGWEITAANILSYRKGHIEDPTGTVIGDTSGWGVGLHLGTLAGVQYDHATVPQSIYLGDTRRNGFSIYVDPLKMARHFR